MTLETTIDRAGVPEPARGPVLAWLRLLEEWNARIDLTAARGEDELVDLMLADALLLAKELPARARVVDVGTGAGAPGLALALVRPDLDVTLVEPLGKRASFLRTVIGTLQRTDVKLLRERADAVAARGRAFDIAISRATLPPDEWLALGLALAPVAWVLLAKEEPPSRTDAVVERDVSYAWPLGGAKRRAVAFRNKG